LTKIAGIAGDRLDQSDLPAVSGLPKVTRKVLGKISNFNSANLFFPL